ncbi:MAG: hypothetical protein J6X28_00505 [Bacilli bacterium]|nr:hypothetical protein [Bacilli bacterium]
MNDLLDFLTSQEIIIVYMIAALACLVCFIVYLIEKNNDNLRKKHNTRELNKLVEEIKEMLPEEEKKDNYEVPVLETIEEKEETSINDIMKQEPMIVEPIDVEETIDLTEVVEQIKEKEEEIEYTTMEPDQETARLELKKLQEELERQERLAQEQANKQEQVQVEQEPMTSYEEEQEKTAIISMEELLTKSKEMYEANALTQYEDEGNEPISIQDLEVQVNRQATVYTEPFKLTNVVSEEEVKKEIEEGFQQVEIKETMHMDDMNTITPETVQPVKQEPEVKKFKNSPIISPIFGIEKDSTRETAMTLENTANYDKLDRELQKNNEFIMSLQELQEK